MFKKGTMLCIILPITLCLASCDNSQRGEHVVIEIHDLTAPIVKITQKTVTITEGNKTFNLENCYEVSDNLTKSPTITITGDNFDPDKPGTYNEKVTAEDEAGNKAEGTFTVKVRAKPKPTPTPTPTPKSTPTPTPEPTPTSNTVEQSSQQKTVNNYVAPSINNDGTTESGQQYEYHETTSNGQGGDQYFKYSDGYNIDSGFDACVAAMQSRGYGTCEAYDSDGDGLDEGYILH